MNMRNRGPMPGQGQPPMASLIRETMTKFSKEVSELIEEIGQLREEKRQLHTDIAELMITKSRHSAGIQYDPGSGWMPPMPAGLPPPPAEPEAPPENKGSAWRSVVRPVPRHKKKPGASGTPKAITAGPLIPASPPPPVQQPGWAQWRPNPNIVPQPRTPAPVPVAVPAKNDGLFGPDD